jgi:hypothetical protein
MKTTVVKCDVCETENDVNEIDIQVLFTTEQTEGRGIKPYNLCNEKLDLCETCRLHILKGNYIYAEGAQGYNKYFFRNKKDG